MLFVKNLLYLCLVLLPSATLVGGCGSGLCGFGGCSVSLVRFVIGQPDFASNTANNGGVSKSSINFSEGVFSDGTRLFVADSENSRVLIWLQIPSDGSTDPDLVLGQPDFTSNAPNNGGLSGSTMRRPHGLFSDGTRLFVADMSNHRILVWSTMPTTNGQSADFALGQPNLTSNTLNSGGLSASSLASPHHVFGDGTRLFVTDRGNHRVLVWNTYPTTDGAAANFALGQPNLSSNTLNNGGVSASTMNSPFSLFSDGMRLLVADTANNRVLLWTTMPTTSGQAANIALGQPDFTSITTNTGGLSGASMDSPAGCQIKGNRILVSEADNHRILVWNEIPTSMGESAEQVFGQPNLTSNTANNGGVSVSSLDGPRGVFSVGDRLWVADSDNNRILAVSTEDLN